MTRGHRLILFAIAPLLLVFGAVEIGLLRDLSAVAGYVAVIGALITGGLGTYTEREANGMLVERPGALREALLGAGVQTVARPAWRVFQVLRTSAWLLILVAFALSLVTSVQGWAGSAERDRRIHSLEQKVDLLYQLPSVPPRVRDAYRQGEAMERAR